MRTTCYSIQFPTVCWYWTHLWITWPSSLFMETIKNVLLFSKCRPSAYNFNWNKEAKEGKSCLRQVDALMNCFSSVVLHSYVQTEVRGSTKMRTFGLFYHLTHVKTAPPDLQVFSPLSVPSTGTTTSSNNKETNNRIQPPCPPLWSSCSSSFTFPFEASDWREIFVPAFLSGQYCFYTNLLLLFGPWLRCCWLRAVVAGFNPHPAKT